MTSDRARWESIYRHGQTETHDSAFGGEPVDIPLPPTWRLGERTMAQVRSGPQGVVSRRHAEAWLNYNLPNRLTSANVGQTAEAFRNFSYTINATGTREWTEQLRQSLRWTN